MAIAETIKVVIEGDTKGLKGALSETKGLLGGLGKLGKVGLGGVAVAGAAAVGAIGAVGAAFATTLDEGLKYDQVSQTFDNLNQSIGETSDVMLADLRNASRNMVNDTDLMMASNRLLSMGLADTREEASDLTEMATQLGMAMGKDATASMEEFALMLANQSIPRLDTFGISAAKVRERIKELQEANENMSREEAFSIAVHEQGTVAMARVGEQGYSAAAGFERFKTAIANVKTAIGGIGVQALTPVLDAFNELWATHGPAVLEVLGHIGEEIGTLVETHLPGLIEGFGEWAENITAEDIEAALGTISGAFETMSGLITENIDAARVSILAFQLDIANFAKILEPLQEVFLGFEDLVNAGSFMEAADAANRIVEGIEGTLSRIGDAFSAGPINQELAAMTVKVQRIATDLGKVEIGYGKIAESLTEAATLTSEVGDRTRPSSAAMRDLATAARDVGSETAASMGDVRTAGGEMTTFLSEGKLAFQELAAGASEGVAGAKTEISTLPPMIKGMMADVQSGWTSSWATIKSSTVSAMAAIRGSVTTGMAGIRSAIVSGINAARASWSSGWASMRAIAAAAVGAIRGSISSLIPALSALGSAARSAGSGFSSLSGAIRGAASSASSAVGSFRAAASALASIKVPSGLQRASPSELEQSLMGADALMRQLSRSTIPELNRAMGGSTTNNTFSLTVHTSASSEDVISDFRLMQALAGA